MNYDEKKRVMTHSAIAHYGKGVMQKTTRYCGDIFRRHMDDGNVLELGPAEGLMTDVLFPYFPEYTVVDGADFYIEAIKQRYPSMKAYSCLFEDFIPDERYNSIILGHVLEHVEDPTNILRMVSSWLAGGGHIFAAVPNSHSIHRQAAVKMGLLERENQLNETDKRNGHRRVYDLDGFKSEFDKAGLHVDVYGGYWLKPVSNAQIDQFWDDNMIDAFLQLGEQYPEIAAEIYVVASL